MKRLSTHSWEKRQTNSGSNTKNNSKQCEQLMLLVSSETVKPCIGFIDSVCTRNSCLVLFGFWCCKFLQQCKFSASKVTEQTCLPKEGGGRLQIGSRSMLTAFEKKVMSMGKR